MRVTTSELARAAETILLHLESIGQTEFEMTEDFYWNIPEDEIYNPYAAPNNLDMGQLSEDLGRVRAILADPDLTVGAGLVWLSSILRRVGEMARG